MEDGRWKTGDAMTEAMAMGGDFEFEAMLDEVLLERVGEAPAGLEQRLMARFALEMEREARSRRPGVFGFAESVRTRRSAASIWTALGVHAAVMLLIAVFVAKHVQLATPVRLSVATLVAPAVRPAVLPKAERIGGGGGQQDVTPVVRGRLPKLAQEQTVPPKAPPTMAPRLAVEPSVVVQKDLKMAESVVPNLGVPNSTLKGVSMGNGSGTGIGSGSGSGIGPGAGGNVGGGVVHIGGSVRAPVLTYMVDPEFSEEARKAKFSGNVQVFLIVDEQGSPTHVRVVRGVGMGLDEKAVEAVRQYRFKPAMQGGKAVKVDLYIEVSFQIF